MSMLKPSFNINYDHFCGYPVSDIELVQYGDFQCRDCVKVYPDIKLLQDMMGHKLKFVFRHFPRPNINPLSLEAAIAAETASLQDKFWYMHDILYENHGSFTRSALVQFAKDIELDMLLYELQREDKKVFRKVIGDFESGVKSGVNITPAFFINGMRYSGPNDFDGLYSTCKLLSAENRNNNNFFNSKS
jgi:protein-disulfide isomerase